LLRPYRHIFIYLGYLIAVNIGTFFTARLFHYGYADFFQSGIADAILSLAIGPFVFVVFVTLVDATARHRYSCWLAPLISCMITALFYLPSSMYGEEVAVDANGAVCYWSFLLDYAIGSFEHSHKYNYWTCLFLGASNQLVLVFIYHYALLRISGFDKQKWTDTENVR